MFAPLAGLRRRTALLAAAVAAMPLLLAACPGDGPGIPVPLDVTVAGTLEQGEVVTVEVRDGATVLDPSLVTLTSAPAGAVEAVAPGELRLLQTGAVEVRAAWGTRSGSRTVEVGAAPPLVLEVAGTIARGEVVAVTVRHRGAALDPAAVQLSVVPASAGEVLPGGQVRLLQSGTVEIRAESGVRAGARTLQVAEPPELSVDVTGALVRGDVVTVTVRSDGAVVDPAAVQLAVLPQGAGEVLDGERVRLLQTGEVEIRATWGTRSGTRTLQVAEPPPLTVEVAGTLQRGEVVTVTVRRDGALVDPGLVEFAVLPQGAGEVLAGGRVRLLQTGEVEVRATWGARSGSRTLQVAEPPALDVAVTGRLERGSTVTLTVQSGGQEVDLASVQLSATPQEAVEMLGGGRARLLATGAVQFRAQGEWRAGSTTVTVAPPPVIVFDMLRDGNRDVWRVALDGGDLVRLTDHPSEDSGPTVAQGTVTFTSFRTGNGELFSVPLAGGAATQLTTTSTSETAVAARPDGQRLAYASDVTGVHKLWVANANGSGRQAALPGFGYAGAIESAPSWAPTGNRLVFMSTAAGSADLWTVNLDGGAPVLLVGGAPAYVNPAWSPSGTHVAFSSTRDGSPAQLYVIEVATGSVTRLTTRAGTDGEPTWTPDGRLVYVAFDAGQTQLRWLDPMHPQTTHAIPTGAGSPRRPAGVR